ncbi:MAG: c-type cytochrome [Thalassovita sp.]
MKNLIATVAMAVVTATSPALPAQANSPIDLMAQDHIDNGSLRFAQNCTYCHGSNGVGGKHRKLQCRDFDPEYLFFTISNGLESGSFFMPPWDDAFSEEKRWELVAFLMSLGQLDSCE